MPSPNRIALGILGGSLTCCLAITLITLPAFAQEQNDNEAWISLFNGENLDGWTPKIRGYALGENFENTFRVEDGVMKVGYEGYDTFGDRFGHIFYKESYSNYRLRLEYRFVGEQAPDGQNWALRNSGIMVHCQDPASMTVDQSFPVSIEVQLLGGDGTNERSTGNLCTPGTNVVMAGMLITKHCINSTSKTYHGEQWVSAEVEVRGNGVIRHIINGSVVLEYERPMLDVTDPEAKALYDNGSPLMIREGYISLQSESHPIEFRKIELLPLESDKTDAASSATNTATPTHSLAGAGENDGCACEAEALQVSADVRPVSATRPAG
ncbi:MAG: DUF1080 domain-containing protein [Candidatus Hydrogenedentes bacterium]|nr:DUF1080 domain-containing protein [Candidatus Hydrogenedentota bacterium]